MGTEYTTITTQEQYNTVAARIEQIKDVSAGSAEAKELRQLTKLIVDFEKKQQPFLPYDSAQS